MDVIFLNLVLSRSFNTIGVGSLAGLFQLSRLTVLETFFSAFLLVVFHPLCSDKMYYVFEYRHLMCAYTCIHMNYHLL